MADIFENLADEEQNSLWMYRIFDRDKIIEKTEQWTKEAEEAGMTLPEYLEAISPLNDKRKKREGMTREEALYRVKGYLTDIIPAEDYSEVEEIIEALEQKPILDKIRAEIRKKLLLAFISGLISNKEEREKALTYIKEIMREEEE